MGKKQNASSREKRKSGRTMVWHIYHFEERFELPDNTRFCRKSPLIYIREYIGTGSDNEQISYRQQIDRLKQHRERHHLRGLFVDLREIAACRSRTYRGYLLNEKLLPAANSWIAAHCGFEIKEIGRLLKILAEIGLIERIPLPKFDPGLDEVPEKAKSKKRKPHQKGIKKRKNSKSRARTKNLERARDALNKYKDKNKDKENRNGQRKTEKIENNNPVRIKSSHNPISEEKENLSSQAHAYPGLYSENEIDTSLSPTTTPDPIPTYPTASDAGVTDTCRNANQPPPSILISQVMDELYCPDSFALQIYQMLGYIRPLDDLWAKQELGAFASAWQRAIDVGMRPTELKILWDKSIQEAEILHRKRRRCRNISKVWMKIFNDRLKLRKAG